MRSLTGRADVAAFVIVGFIGIDLRLTIALFVFAAGFWWLTRRGTESGRWPRWLVTVVGALAIVTAVATGVQVARIGHSGAEAAWSDVGS